MKATVLRLTRHEAGPDQLAALKRAVARLMGVQEADLGLAVRQVSVTVLDVTDVVEMVKEAGVDVLEAVLPISILAQALPLLEEMGVPVIRAVMDRELQPDGTAKFNFRGYERLIRVIVEAEPLA